MLFLDVVVSQHPAASVSSVHACIGNYLKMAPWREGGAGKGCRIEVRDDGGIEGNDTEALSDHAEESDCDVPSRNDIGVAGHDSMSDVESDTSSAV